MAQTGYTPILIYSSSTGGNTPAAGNLTNSTLGSELAINITDGKLFYKDNGGSVQVIGWKTVPTTAGGTGLTSYSAGDLLYYASGTALTKLAIGVSGRYLSSNGTAPQWSAPAALTKTDDTNVTLTLGGSASTALLNAASLTLGWTGQLAVGRGGTGLASFTANGIVYASGTTTLASGSALTFNGSTFQLTATGSDYIYAYNSTASPSGSSSPSPRVGFYGAEWNSGTGSVSMSGYLQLQALTTNVASPTSKLSINLAGNGGTPAEVGYFGSNSAFVLYGNQTLTATAGNTSLTIANTTASTSATPQPSNKLFLTGTSWNSANGNQSRTGYIRSNTALNNANPTVESITIAPDDGAGGQNEAFAFCGNGRFGIGTLAPAYALQVSTDSAAKPSTNTWTIASDARIKNILGDYEKGLDEICQLRPIRYTYNNKAGFPESLGEQVSIVAQDAKIPFPECVGTFKAKLEETDKEETELYNWNGHAVTFALINSVKTLKAMVEQVTADFENYKKTHP